MSCACELADAGIEVSLLEARKSLGGRAFSFRDKETGVIIDNSQHVILGCCNNAIGFLTKIGSIGRVEFSDTINIIGAAENKLSIKSSILPAPLHLLPSIMRTKYLSSHEKLDLSKVLARMLFHQSGNHENAGEYLTSLSCSSDLAKRMIDPILVSALNEGTGVASARYARMVLVKALLESRFGYRLGIPNVSLSELIEYPAREYLSQRGCEIHTSAKVEKLNIENKQIESITLLGGSELKFDYYICALPPAQLRRIGYDTPAADGLIWRAIVSAHLFFEETSPSFKHVCLASEPFQWLFNKSYCSNGLGYIQAVASVVDNVANMSREKIVSLAMQAVRKALPGMESTLPKHTVIVHEKRATFSTGSDCDAFRPSSRTSLENLFLAGDWTDTQWPATIESAVRSGYAAARALNNII